MMVNTSYIGQLDFQHPALLTGTLGGALWQNLWNSTNWIAIEENANVMNWSETFLKS